MPGLSGTALERLLSHEFPSTPVILMSGYLDHPLLNHVNART
jgi:FixJ family two-component response regulator